MSSAILANPESSRLGDILIDTSRHLVKIGPDEVDLTLKEFNLLLFFVKKKGMVVSRSELLNKVWGSSTTDAERTVDIHICRLRKKIEPNPRFPKHLVSVRGLGYKLRG